MNATIARLVDVRQEFDRLTVKCGIDPDRNPVSAEACGKVVLVRCDGRPMWEVRRGRVYSVRTGEHLGTVAQVVRFWKQRNARARDAGEVEYAERKRLDVLARRHALTGDLPTDYDALVGLTRSRFALRFRTPKTAKARREVAELRRRLTGG